jgi:hypothetical protein
LKRVGQKETIIKEIAGIENFKATSTTPKFGTWSNQVAAAGREVRRAPPWHPPTFPSV